MSKVQFKKLLIERIPYGDDRGKLRGELVVEGKAAKVECILSNEVATAILRSHVELIAFAATDSAAAFRDELLSSVNSTTDDMEGASQ